MHLRRLLLLLAASVYLAGCTPRLHGSYIVQPALHDPHPFILTFTGNRFRSCYDAGNSSIKGSGTFTFRKGVLTLSYGATPAYSADPLAMHLTSSHTLRVPAGTVARYQYAPAKRRHAFKLTFIMPPVDTAYINYKLLLGVPAEELEVREPEVQLCHRISDKEAAECFFEY